MVDGFSLNLNHFKFSSQAFEEFSFLWDILAHQSCKQYLYNGYSGCRGSDFPGSDNRACVETHNGMKTTTLGYQARMCFGAKERREPSMETIHRIIILNQKVHILN